MSRIGSGEQSLDRGIEDLAAALAADGRVRFAYLFGSQARGDATVTSDVDIAVHLTDEADPAVTPPELAALASLALRSDAVDLVVLDRAPLPLRYRIVRDRRVILDRDPAFRVAFESRTLREGWDFQPYERTMLGLPSSARGPQG